MPELEQIARLAYRNACNMIAEVLKGAVMGRKELRRRVRIQNIEILEQFTRAGLVIGRQRPDTASGVVFVTMDDETGCINVVIWDDLAERQRRELLGSRLIAVYGVLEREGEVIHLIARKLVDHSAWLGKLRTRSRDFH